MLAGIPVLGVLTQIVNSIQMPALTIAEWLIRLAVILVGHNATQEELTRQQVLNARRLAELEEEAKFKKD